MDFLSELAQNKILTSAATGWIIAQVLKTIIHTWFTKNFVAERLVGGGGMPSSHSATVCALSTATAMQYGAASFEFAMAAIFALVVMYDAIGVRQESGKQAKVINDMVELFAHMGKDVDIEKQLKEFIGHTPLQVLCGAILGIITAFVIMT
ncbi:MAG: divergent PAP2 family protein [Lachnospiraceae bacterium]|nr:divergent PAP2 family protein [Lachnospiraceae bacterium]